MDLLSITIIGFHFNPTSSSERLIKHAPTRTPDPKITSESNRKDQGKFKHPIPSVYNGTRCV